MSNPTPPVAVLVVHSVTDYATWKSVFDKHQSAREAASALGHDVLRAENDPNRIYVYVPGSNAEKLKGFVDSPDLRDIMQKAGVTSPPTITFMKPIADNTLNDTSLASMVITHDVKDYAQWKTAYDAFAKTRKEKGIVGDAVNQVLGKPNSVVVYHQARDFKTLRALLNSAELKGAMERAGVTSAPDVQFVQSLDTAEY